MIDLSKAFDTINHKLLIKKLDAYGIQETELSWFHSYLSERKQRVILNGEHSEWTSVTMGVPQGSILGPLLFLLFVNDLPDVVEDCTVNLYADDTTIYSSDEDPKELCSRVEKDLERVTAWFKENRLLINVMKTQLMVLTRKGKSHEANEINVKIGDTTLDKKSCVTYLGVKLDKDLSWKVHIENLHRQCSAKLAIIRRACHYLPQKVKAMLYQALVLPHTDYCSVVWNNCGAVLHGKNPKLRPQNDHA